MSEVSTASIVQIDPTLARVERLRELFRPFLDANPSSDIELQTHEGDKRLVIELPWNDPSIIFTLPEDDNEASEIAAHLNKVFLPERYAAIWHSDISELEIIYTAHPVDQDIKARSFEFLYRGQTFNCQFKKASDRLLTMANMTQPVAITTTNYRNLWSFDHYVQHRKAIDAGKSSPFYFVEEPICFWIKGLDQWDDEAVQNLLPHLNFYMRYFDTKSPVIVSHSPEAEKLTSKPRTRYRNDGFPVKICSGELDKTLLHFWDASRIGDSARRFGYSYRIIEYASFFHLDEKIRKEIRRVLCDPSAHSNVDRLIDKILGQLPDRKGDDQQKIEALLRKVIGDPSVIWKELSQNISFFETATTFDGGVVVEALVKPGASANSIEMGTLARTLKDVRNALSHGRDQRTSGVITPTPENFNRLRPWAVLASTIAEEVMVYKDLP